MPHTFDIAGKRRHRLSVDDFHRLADSRILAEEERVELIGGEPIDVTPIGSRRAAAVRSLINQLAGQFGKEHWVDARSPVRLDEDSEPQPDGAVIRRRDHGPATGLPTFQEIHLGVEAADTSLAFDRDIKLPLYARSAGPEDLQGELEVHSGPNVGEYSHMGRYRRGMSLSSPVRGIPLDGDALLPAG